MSGTINVSTNDKETIISINGIFNFELHSPFRAAYRNDSDKNNQGKHFVIDMSNTEHIDSAALGMLLMMREYTNATQSVIKIINMRPAIRKIMMVSNFCRLFTIE